MKKIFFFLIFFSVLSSCDIIEDPYIQLGANGCTVPEPAFTPRTSPVRKVLVEDITGHRCGNCPRAAEKVHDLIVAHPDQVVAISVHSELSGYFTSPLGDTGKYSYDFRTELGKEIDEKFGVSAVGLPNGLINRIKSGNTAVVPYTQWENKVTNLLNTPPVMDVQIKNFYDASDSSLCSYVYAEALQNMNGTFKVVCYLVENDFINWQKDYAYPGEDIQTYHHEHVLRTSLSTYWGTLLANVIDAGASFVNGYSIKFNHDRWKIDNCYVIAFVYNEDTDEVIQAEQQKVIN
jgi:hypothetical protein